MIIANKYEVPDSCPWDCSLKPQSFGQGDICCRCPIFNCTIIDAPEEYGGPFCLVSPENYREDWAKEWEEFFKTGKEPILYLQRRDENETI